MLNRDKIKIMTLVISLCGALNNVYALEPLDNDALSKASAQDGLTITLQNIAPNARLIWIDNTGVNASEGIIDPAEFGFTNPSSAGAVMLGDGTRAGNFRISEGTTVLTLDSDAGNGSPFVNLNVKLPEDLNIQTGDIFVAERESDGTYVGTTKIMRDMRIDIGGLEMNVQLGSSPQGSMLVAYGTVNDGVKISNIGLIGAEDSGDEFGVGISEMKIKDAGISQDLTINGAAVSVTPDGLVLKPSTGKEVDVLMQDFKLGNLSSADNGIGDIALKGLRIGNHTITITGH